jgi:hypothetical protein
MVVPLAARWVAAGCGILLVLGGWPALADAGSSIFTLGFAEPAGTRTRTTGSA